MIPYTGADTQWNSSNMLPNQNTIVAQGSQAGKDALAANQKSQGLQLSKYMSAYGSDNPSAQAAVQQGLQNSTDIASQNFQARMAEAQVRAQIHQSYMSNLWHAFSFQKKQDKFGMIGAGLGAVGLAGVTIAHPDTPGNKFQSDYTESHIGSSEYDEAGTGEVPSGGSTTNW